LSGEEIFLKNSDQARFWIVTAALILVFVVMAMGGYLLLKESPESVPKVEQTAEPALPRMANLPEKKSPITPPPPPSYPPDAPVLEQAREALREEISADDAVILAKSLPASPERADAAFLLLEYAADKGNAEAALLVARYYDPTDETQSGTIRKNPETAYEWYREALSGGQDEAGKQLARLHLWVEVQAQQGSFEARQLLKNWP
jgi:TPR repeat protein